MKETKILIADDNPSVRRVLEHCLRAENRVMLTAVDGDAALEMARTHHPDLIILDVCMPGRDGYAVCAALRADASTSAIPIMMLTGYGGEEASADARLLGADACVSKPFERTDLLARVGALLWSR